MHKGCINIGTYSLKGDSPIGDVDGIEVLESVMAVPIALTTIPDSPSKSKH